MSDNLVPAYPSMSESGWMRGIIPIATRVMDNYLRTNYSQSNIESGGMVSLAYDIQRSSNRPQALEDNIRFSINAVLSRYYPLVDVVVKVDDDEDEVDLVISIKARFGREGYSGDLVKTIATDRDGGGDFKILE